LTFLAKDKLDVRMSIASRGKTIATKFDREVQEAKKQELLKAERQKVRLPPCGGIPKVDALDDARLDEYLTHVGDHRLAPCNSKSLPTLSCLEGTVDSRGTPYGPNNPNNGLATKRVLQALLPSRDEPKMRLKSSPRGASARRRREASARQNPLGPVVPNDAKYADTQPTDDIRPETVESMYSVRDSTIEETLQLPESHGDDDNILSTSTACPESTMLPRATTPSSAAELGSAILPEATTSRESTSAAQVGRNLGLRTAVSLPSFPSPSSKGGEREFLESRGNASSSARQTRLMRQKNICMKVMAGKCMLVLTESADVRKSMTKILPPDGINVMFSNSSQNLWMKLHDPKETFSILFLDLSKKELQVERLLQVIRQDRKYAAVPIVVMSLELALPECVRQHCNYVIYLPFSPTSLREALVWCFDRRCAEKVFRSSDALAKDRDLAAASAM
jgi:CheY-like chemotaxis protein